jgi:predicted nucleic acid-binding protein
MPTSYAVLDSGTLLATVQTETYTEHAKGLIAYMAQEQAQMIAPALLRYELVAVIRKWVYRELTTRDKAEHALNILLNYPVTTVADDGLLRRAYDIATEFNRPTAYDAQYLAVAERYSCDFWTADERLFNAASGKFSRIYWLGDFQIER